MKRKILASILGVAAMVAASTTYGQGKVNLNNYNGTGNQILYSGNIAGGTTGAGIVGNGTVPAWTIGFYYALGDVTASVAADPSGTAAPSGGGLAFATGAPGDTTLINSGNGKPGGGYFTSVPDAVINGWTSGTVTFEVSLIAAQITPVRVSEAILRPSRSLRPIQLLRRLELVASVVACRDSASLPCRNRQPSHWPVSEPLL